MSKILVCDLCGEPINIQWDLAQFYKIKVKTNMIGSSWKRIDAHNECITVLFEKEKQKTCPPNVGSSMQDD